MPLERYQQVMHGAGTVGHGDDDAGAILPAGCGRRQRMRQADDGEARAVVGIVLNGMRHHVQAELLGRAFAGQAGDVGVQRRQAGAFGVAGHRAAFGMRQMLGQPALTLGQGLGVSRNHLDAFGRVGAAQQVVAHQQADLSHHVAGRMQEHVQRARDHAFVGVLHAHHSVLRAARGRGVEHLVEAVAVHQVGRAAEILDGRFLAERARRAQHGHALG
ncbi:hypothetical protein GY14_10400 [Delftia tsuruhatensis]|nr:hypothetical protein GY14_10400 [Delftia tsuruhatensis]